MRYLLQTNTALIDGARMRRDLSVHCGNADMAWIGQYGLGVD